MADYKSMVQSNVKRAFGLIGNLAKEVTLYSEKPISFDFNTATTIPDTSGSITLSVIISSKDKDGNSNDRASISRDVLAISADAPNLNLYDKLSIDGEYWRIVHPINDNGFTVSFKIVREL